MIAPVTSLQPRYSQLHREVETEILPHCQSEGIGVIVYSPMRRIASLPKDDWRKGHADFNEPNLSRHLALVDHLKEFARRRGRSAGEVALASDNA
jgi:aryl-alcohol dehydrogenase-like predicted oxidoreductase